MNIDQLYAELGRADAAACDSKRQYEELTESQRREVRALERQHQTVRDEAKAKHEKIMRRLDTLRETARLVQEGFDPLIAKMQITNPPEIAISELGDYYEECVEDIKDDEMVGVSPTL